MIREPFNPLPVNDEPNMELYEEMIKLRDRYRDKMLEFYPCEEDEKYTFDYNDDVVKELACHKERHVRLMIEMGNKVLDAIPEGAKLNEYGDIDIDVNFEIELDYGLRYEGYDVIETGSMYFHFGYFGDFEFDSGIELWMNTLIDSIKIKSRYEGDDDVKYSTMGINFIVGDVIENKDNYTQKMTASVIFTWDDKPLADLIF